MTTNRRRDILYYREIEKFMRYHHCERFKMIQLVRVVGGKPNGVRDWERKRKAIRRVLEELHRLGLVTAREPAAKNGSYKTYQWKTRPGHEVVQNREQNRDN